MNFLDLLSWVAAFLGFVACAGIAALAYGYRGHFGPPGQAVRHFASGQLLIFGAVAVILFTSDLLWVFARCAGISERIVTVSELVVLVPALLAALVGIYQGHIALWLLIPEDRRSRWRWWSAWLYPRNIARFA